MYPGEAHRGGAAGGGGRPAPGARPRPRPVLLPVLLLLLAGLAALQARAALHPEGLRRVLEGDAARAFGIPAAEIRDHLLPLYRAREFQPIWCSASGPRPGARIVLRALRHAAREGLSPDRYGVSTLDALWPADGAAAPGVATRLEVLITAGILRYARDLRTGSLDPAAVDPDWHLRPDPFDPVAWLRDALETGTLVAALAALPPPQPGYGRLRAALAHYRRLATTGPWPRLEAGPLLRPGTRHRQVALLRRRLRLEGDLVLGPVVDPEVFDRPLEEAVARFQTRHGLAPDGVVGPRTRAALAESPRDLIRRIRVNMERWRWMPRRMGERYVLVNIGGFELHLVELGQTVVAMRAIVGKLERQTPSFRAMLTHLVVNPAWSVPPRIAEEDLVPAQVRDPQHFRRLGIRVYSGWSADARELDPAQIDWKSFLGRHLPYHLVQDPGPANALGRIKFMLPNPYDIYLHDTPGRSLFDARTRAFSSGCIRIEQPLDLARHLLADQPGAWSELQRWLKLGETRTIRLDRPLPVYLLYLTTWVEPDGTPYFHRDVYGRDAAVARVLPPLPRVAEGVTQATELPPGGSEY